MNFDPLFAAPANDQLFAARPSPTPHDNPAYWRTSERSPAGCRKALVDRANSIRPIHQHHGHRRATGRRKLDDVGGATIRRWVTEST